MWVEVSIEGGGRFCYSATVPGDAVLVIDDSPTILKVVQLVLTKAGFSVQTAADGEEGIQRALSTRPSLILLDFVMPKMNGYQVCRALADSTELKDVPVVLMSAKGDQVGERFVKVMGIVDYITKPFSPEAITAVVQHTIAKYGPQKPATPDKPKSGNGEASGLHEHVADDEANPPTDRTSPRVPQGMSGNPFARRLDAMAVFREALIDAIAGDELVGEIADKVRERLDDGTLERMMEPAARAFGGGEDNVSLRGNLAEVPIAEVLSLLQQQRQWGVLRVTRAGDPQSAEQAVDVCFKQGKVELCLAAGLGEEFLVGRYLVDQMALSRQDLELFIKSRSAVGKPIGEQLVKLNYCTEAELKGALSRQAAERIYELLRWPAGRFTFTASRELPPLAIDAALALDIDGVLMEGFRRVDEWHLIEREVDDFDCVYLRNEEAVQNVGKARLTREELAILELVNGKHTIKDIVRQSRMGSFDVSKMLFRLHSIKLIRRRVAPVAV
jgi:DNA-binding response OmpR family regulator